MAMSFMIRKASSNAVIPLAVRAGIILNNHTFIKLADEQQKNFSTVVDPNPEIKILDKQLNEILRARTNKLILPQALPLTPANFPYTIEDTDEDEYKDDSYYDNMIMLKREIGSEKIEIKVDMLDYISGSDAILDKVSRNEAKLDIKVSRENGSSLSFSLVKPFGKEFTIESMSVHPGSRSYDSYVKELWPDVYEALKIYLEIKFVKDLDFEFINKYMTIRDELVMLNELKQPFVKGSKAVDANQEVLLEKHKKNFIMGVDPNSEVRIVEKKLNEILRSRLKTAKLFPREMPPSPANFPFTIEHNPTRFPDITLKREIGSEKIKIKVDTNMDCQPKLGNMMEEINGVDSSDGDNHPSKKPWNLTVKVSRKNESALTLEVMVMAFEKGYEILNIILNEKKDKDRSRFFVEPSRWDVEEQEVLRKYLEVRGLKDIDYEYLKNYKQACVAREQLFLLSEVELFFKGCKDVDAEQDFVEE